MCNWPLNNTCLNCMGPLSLKLFLFYWLICFVAVLGLPCCVWAFSSWSQQGLLSGCNAQASHCGGFFCCGECGLSSLGIGALLPHTMWNLPGAGIQPLSPAMPGRSLTTPIQEQNIFKLNVYPLPNVMYVMIHVHCEGHIITHITGQHTLSDTRNLGRWQY